MEALENMVVTLSYELHEKDANGELLDKSKDDHPLIFLFGTGSLLPKFEDNIRGLKQDDDFEFALTSVDAYGEAKDELHVDVPIEAFMVDGKVQDQVLQAGNVLSMQDQNGAPMRGMVKERKLETVVMDFNHPMAGKDLWFSGKVKEVRPATTEELSHGHVHGPGGHQH